MKCPKCGYLGFENVERCRNCGYDFSLSQQVEAPELPIRINEDETPESAPGELPLFGGRIERSASSGRAHARSEDDDVPLITTPSPPRQPLAVRRSTPEAPRLRTEQQPRAQTLELALDDMQVPDEVEASLGPAERARSAAWPQAGAGPETAGIAARFGAVVIDLGVLVLVDLAVIYFTMEICGVTLGDLGVLPKGPLLAFLLVQNGGYLVAFTAGGQTLGKMMTGIRVVTAGSGSSLDFGRASMRTLVWLLLVIPAGLGLLTAVFSQDRRGLHDRCAGSRVVRASA